MTTPSSLDQDDQAEPGTRLRLVSKGFQSPLNRRDVQMLASIFGVAAQVIRDLTVSAEKVELTVTYDPEPMQTWQNPTIDKTSWGPGPWQDEPDKTQWVDKATGLDCLIVRTPVGNLCGYVGVPPGHPAYGVHYTSGHEEVDDLSVHGGITFSDKCHELSKGDPAGAICHIPEPGRPAEIWWLGFDCAHYMDFVPGMAAMMRDMGLGAAARLHPADEYRTLAYVQQECADLARQLQLMSEH